MIVDNQKQATAAIHTKEFVMNNDDVVVSCSDHLVLVYETMIHRVSVEFWEVTTGSDFYPLRVEDMREFVRTMELELAEQIDPEPHRQTVVISDQTAVRLHVIGAINLADARVVKGELRLPKIEIGTYEFPVRIVSTSEYSLDAGQTCGYHLTYPRLAAVR